MNRDTFTTISDLYAYIGDCIEGTGEASRDEYDLDAIAHEIAEWDPAAQAFRDTTDTDEFWASVQAHYVGEATA